MAGSDVAAGGARSGASCTALPALGVDLLPWAARITQASRWSLRAYSGTVLLHAGHDVKRDPSWDPLTASGVARGCWADGAVP